MKTLTDTLEVSRSNQYEQLRKAPEARKRHYKRAEDAYYLRLIRKITDERPTYGYRRVRAILNRYLRVLGQPGVNHKRVYRLMKLNGLLLHRYTGKPTRSHEGKVMVP